MSAKSRIPSVGLFALHAGESRERSRRQMSLARQAKQEGRSPLIFVACARIHWHSYLKDMGAAAQCAEVMAQLQRINSMSLTKQQLLRELSA